VEILKQLHEAVHRKRPELSILHHDNAPAHMVLYLKQFLAKKLITEIECPPRSPNLALNDFWLFPQIKCILKG
jgi:hypothetical protein